jgi:hypothetical protein
MYNTHPKVTDPTKFVLPFLQCGICFASISREIGYCENCGETHLSKHSEFLEGQRCINHPTVAAKALCRLCDNPICAECEGERGITISGEPDYTCKRCLVRIDQLKHSFRERLDKEKVCAKHVDEKAVFRCVSCGLPHCAACPVFHTKGHFQVTTRKGTFMLQVL